MKLLVTSVVRGSSRREPSGAVTTVDLDAGVADKTCPIPEADFLLFDINPRGGLRGGKGIALTDNRICFATASHILLYDYQWSLRSVITHPSCASIHDMVERDGSLWVTSTENDLVFQFDLGGRILSTFNYKDHAVTIRELGLKPSQTIPLDRDAILAGSRDYRDPRTHRIAQTNNAHLNSLCFLENGDMLVSLGRLTPWKMAVLMSLKGILTKARIYAIIVAVNQALIKLLGLKRQKNSALAFVPATAQSVILRVTPAGACTILFRFDDTTVPNHSLCPLDNGTVLYCDTNNGNLLVLDPDSGTVCKRIFVAEDFLRGIEPLSQTLVAVGSQHTVHVVDLEREAVVQKVQISEDPRVAIFDIQVLPPGVASLPDVLAEPDRSEIPEDS